MEKEHTVFNERVRLALRMAFPGRPVSAADELADSLASGTTIARVSLGAARDAVLMAALAHWLTAEAGRTALVVAPEDRDVAGLKKAFDQTGLAAGLGCTILGRDGVVESADVTIGSLDAIATRTAAGVVDARGFDVVALSGLDSLSDVASAAMLRRAIGPANESRRLVALSSILGPAHRNLVRDLGGAYVELELEAEEERVKMAPCVTYDVPSDKKMALFRSVL
ncbi:MAG: hypothetical protein JXM71_03320, partial [Spirochaetales bacterium]|nr:hypothetical protein [Spirochaetales bacterium]